MAAAITPPAMASTTPARSRRDLGADAWSGAAGADAGSLVVTTGGQPGRGAVCTASVVVCGTVVVGMSDDGAPRRRRRRPLARSRARVGRARGEPSPIVRGLLDPLHELGPVGDRLRRERLHPVADGARVRGRDRLLEGGREFARGRVATRGGSARAPSRSPDRRRRGWRRTRSVAGWAPSRSRRCSRRAGRTRRAGVASPSPTGRRRPPRCRSSDRWDGS